MFRNPLAILLFVCGSPWAGSAVPIVSIGDYIVLYGELDDCPEFPGILEALQVDDSHQIFLDLDPIRTVGSTPAEILAKLSDQIAQARPDQEPPRSLRIEVLSSKQEYLMIRDQLLASKRFLAFSGRRCGGHKPLRDRPDPIDPDWYRIAGTPSSSLQGAFESDT